MSIFRRLIRKLSTLRPLLFPVTVLVLGSAQFSPGAETTPQFGIPSKTADARAFSKARIVIAAGIEYENGRLLIGDEYVIEMSYYG